MDNPTAGILPPGRDPPRLSCYTDPIMLTAPVIFGHDHGLA
jgi:hypothetical protein